MTQRRDIITTLVKRDTRPLRNSSLLVHLIGRGGLLALMVEENDLCVQHEKVL